MEREIKFRVYDSISKMIHNWERIKRLNFYDFIQLEHYTLMQFTGFYDKNGNEIYEGDIVTVIALDANYIMDYDGSVDGVIEWSNDNFTYIIKWDKTRVEWEYDRIEFAYDDCGGEIKVVGNIYENLNLINQH